MKLNNWLVLEYIELTSTNEEAVRLSHNPPSSHYIAMAAMQTEGRGRRGRVWHSLEGNLFFSQAFAVAPQQSTEIVFIISLSLYQALSELAPQLSIQLKWPNDVLAENHKLSGILLEKGENEYIIAGIGVNIKNAPQHDETMLYPAACLADFGINTAKDAILEAYLRAFDKNFALWLRQGFSPIRQQWLSHAKGLGQEIVIRSEKKSITGIFQGLNHDGALLLQQTDKVLPIYVGDVFYKED